MGRKERERIRGEERERESVSRKTCCGWCSMGATSKEEDDDDDDDEEERGRNEENL
jgi:hypothetical protein